MDAAAEHNGTESEAMLAELGFRTRLLLACLYHGFLLCGVLSLSSWGFEIGEEVVFFLSLLSGRTSPGSIGLLNTSSPCPVPLKQAAQGHIGTDGLKLDGCAVWLCHHAINSDFMMKFSWLGCKVICSRHFVITYLTYISRLDFNWILKIIFVGFKTIV